MKHCMVLLWALNTAYVVDREWWVLGDLWGFQWGYARTDIGFDLEKKIFFFTVGEFEKCLK